MDAPTVDPPAVDPPAPEPPAVDRFAPRGWTLRLVATTVCVGLLLAGSIWGDDDHFPFGPFRMYATNEGPNAPVPDPRVEAVTASGRVIFLVSENSGVKRAEIEGQLPLFTANPSRLERLADAYARLNPRERPLVEVRIIQRMHGVRDGRPTGRYTDTTIARWRRA